MSQRDGMRHLTDTPRSKRPHAVIDNAKARDEALRALLGPPDFCVTPGLAGHVNAALSLYFAARGAVAETRGA